MAKYHGTGRIAETDYKTVKWVGKTKSGAPCTIELQNAINMSDIDWTFAEKDDVVPQIVFTATYDNTDKASESTNEPFTIEIGGAGALASGAGEIALGAGIFYVGEKQVALSRGGGNFKVTREFRRINADGDRGPVKGRIEIEGSEATLTMNVLTMLTAMADLYPGIELVSE